MWVLFYKPNKTAPTFLHFILINQNFISEKIFISAESVVGIESYRIIQDLSFWDNKLKNRYSQTNCWKHKALIFIS